VALPKSLAPELLLQAYAAACLRWCARLCPGEDPRGWGRADGSKSEDKCSGAKSWREPHSLTRINRSLYLHKISLVSGNYPGRLEVFILAGQNIINASGISKLLISALFSFCFPSCFCHSLRDSRASARALRFLYN
jgi:hypothetical protein